ncbi:hypothetical protein IC582_002131 [Cucumis melo]
MIPLLPSATLTAKGIKEMKEIAFGTIILYLAENVLRHIPEAKTAEKRYELS